MTAIGLVAFVVSSRRHEAPIIDAALLRVRAFAWSNATSLLFAVPFAAALLTNILWMQQVWHYSAIRTGLAIAPGPLMVPIFAAVAHRLARRIPVGLVVATGCLLLGAGSLVTSTLVSATPDYAGAILPGWLIGGVGVGLALPSILSSATADLPPARAATGSAVVNMNRQIGTALASASSSPSWARRSATRRRTTRSGTPGGRWPPSPSSPPSPPPAMTPARPAAT